MIRYLGPMIRSFPSNRFVAITINRIVLCSLVEA